MFLFCNNKAYNKTLKYNDCILTIQHRSAYTVCSSKDITQIFMAALLVIA